MKLSRLIQLKHGLTLWALFVSAPIFVLFLSWYQPQWDVWKHLLDYLLSEYLSNTLLLGIGVGILSASIGVFCAWFVSQYHLPFQKTIQRLLFLPLAIPSYILAYVYTGLFEFSAPLSSFLREKGYTGLLSIIPDIQNLPGTIVIMSMVLFPYVYALALVAFKNQSQSYYDVARNMGNSEFGYFKSVALPMAAPAIIAGCSLAMMEAFADFGTVEYMGVPTFTTGIFRVWFGMNNVLAAAQLSATLVCFVLLLLWVEKWSRKRQRYFQTSSTSAVSKRHLSTSSKYMVLGTLFFIIVVTFALPVMQLVQWAYLSVLNDVDIQVLTLITNSFLLGLTAAVIIVLFCSLLVFMRRVENSKTLRVISGFISVGYAFPGTVIAVGTVWFLTSIDVSLNEFTVEWFGTQVGLLFSGTIFALIFAYIVRFSTVGLHYMQDGVQRIKPSIDEAARGFGLSRLAMFGQIHFPLMYQSFLAAILVIFVDIIKELPATLILRPFNFDTLAVKTYELAKDERVADASLPALCIVAVGLLPVLLLGKLEKNEK